MTDYQVIMSLNDRDLQEVRNWIRRLLIIEEPPQSETTLRRNDKRDYTPRAWTHWAIGGIHKPCGSIITKDSFWFIKGVRYCKVCGRLRQRKYYRNKKAKVLQPTPSTIR